MYTAIKHSMQIPPVTFDVNCRWWYMP